MSEAKHTPGPWSLERVPIQSRGGSNTAYKIGPFTCCLYDDWRPREAGTSEGENAANARLMAAAPDLLAACKMALRDVGDGGPSSDYASAYTVSQIKAAIARAEGRA